jgi:hypothetical protein
LSTGGVALPLALSCCRFCNGCLRVQFTPRRRHS